MWSAIAHYRYLLLACLVLTTGIAVECLLIHPPPSFSGPSAGPCRLPLREKYESIQTGIPVQQAREILGEPDHIEPLLSCSELWVWRDGQDSLSLVICTWGNTPVMSKHFHAAMQETGRQKSP
jgi:hypothetical protein